MTQDRCPECDHSFNPWYKECWEDKNDPIIGNLVTCHCQAKYHEDNFVAENWANYWKKS